MSARRTTLIPSNEIWRTLSDDEKNQINRDEGDRIIDCEIEDEIELVRRIDAAGENGYRLPKPSDTSLADSIAMNLAACRLSANSGRIYLAEIEPFTMIRIREFRPRTRVVREQRESDPEPVIAESVVEDEQLPIFDAKPTVAIVIDEIEKETVLDDAAPIRVEEPFKLSNPDAWSMTRAGRRRRR
jgi:hypothetical protein